MTELLLYASAWLLSIILGFAASCRMAPPVDEALETSVISESSKT